MAKKSKVEKWKRKWRLQIIKNEAKTNLGATDVHCVCLQGCFWAMAIILCFLLVRQLPAPDFPLPTGAR